MHDTFMSPESTSSEAPWYSRRRMKKSLADELDSAFDDVPLSPEENFLYPTKGSNERWEEETEDTRRFEDVVLEDAERGRATECQSTSPTIADNDSDSPATLVAKDEEPPFVHAVSHTAPGETFKTSNFIEHLSPDTAPQPLSFKEHQRLLASKHNRDLIDRNADGFFDMETMPKATDVERRVQQSQGIAALQRTLVPAPVSNTAPSSTGSSHASSSTVVESMKHPSSLRHVTFAESKGRRRDNIQGPFPYPPSRPHKATRFSLARDLIAAGHRSKPPEPPAPTRFVKTPADPVLNFKRNFADCGLKITIPERDEEGCRGYDSGSITSVPDVDSAGGFTFMKPAPKLSFGVPRAFMPNQCLESTCPMRWAHAKGPYHHRGHRPDKIMTGLFGHSNPPPEIWNAYRNMVRLTRDGEMLSPDGRPRPQAEDDLVIAFATLHYGGFNGMTGGEFRRRYAGKHIPSRLAPQPARTTSSQGSSLES